MKKAILVLSFLMCMVMSACQNKGQTADISTETETDEFLTQDEFGAQISGVSGYAMVCENDKYALFIDGSTCEIDFLDKQTQKHYYSNPQARDVDNLAGGDGLNMLSSQLILYYRNARGENFQYYTSANSVDLGQFSFEKIEDGIRVNYIVGEKKKIYVYPPRITEERMEYFLEKMSEEDRSSIEFLYYLVDLEELNDVDRKSYTTESPILEEHSRFYTIDGLFRGSAGIASVPEYAATEAEEIFARVGYTKEDMERDYEETGLEIPESKNAIFEISVEYTIDENGLCVTVPNDSIDFERNKFYLTEVDVLPYFAAAGVSDTGYMLVPDGMGALIELNNGKTQYEAYKKQVYGEDKSVNYAQLQTTDGVAAYIPAFGLATKNYGFVGFVESGDASCSITADVSERYHGYNHVSAVFLTTPNALIDSDSSISAIDFQKEIMSCDLSVRYMVLEEGSFTYSGMANKLREYFLESERLTLEQVTNSPVINLVGAVKYQKNFMGIERYVPKPLTTYSQTQEIYEWFSENCDSELDVLYEGWGNEGYENRLANKAATVKELGSKKEFSKMLSEASDKGVSITPDVNFMYVSQRSAGGFSESKYSAKNIQGAVATVVNYEYGTMRKTDIAGDYIVKPAKFMDLSDSFFKKYQQYGVSNIYLSAMGTDLNSDFNRGKLVDRAQAINYIEELLKEVSEKYSITVSGGNAYTYGYVDRIVDLPLQSGHAYIIDRDVPFMSMVLSGTVELNTLVAGEYSDDWYTLKMIEAGVWPQFNLIYSDTAELRECDTELLVSSYSTVRENAKDMIHSVTSALQKVNGSCITEHEYQENGVSITRYQNGYSVIVNFSETTQNVEGNQIEGKTWLVINERGEKE